MPAVDWHEHPRFILLFGGAVYLGRVYDKSKRARMSLLANVKVLIGYYAILDQVGLRTIVNQFR